MTTHLPACLLLLLLLLLLLPVMLLPATCLPRTLCSLPFLCRAGSPAYAR